MNKLVFVILHYQVIAQTINCIKSIKAKIDISNYEIVIVDNNSTNGTGKQLEQMYKEDDKVHIILNNENLGFARGNNIGYKYAKEELNADFIAMINNDTCIIQNDFFKIIQDEYKQSNFAVMGPKIILLNNQINPLHSRPITLKNIKKERRSLFVNLILNYLHIENLYINVKMKINKNIKKQIKKILGRTEQKVKNTDCRYEDIILHGCCFIFSPVYINKFEGLDDRTFLYHEEELLYLRLKSNNMLSVYNPKLLIFHEEDASTNAIVSSENKKRRFVYKNLLKSNKVLLDDLKKWSKNYE